MSKGFKIGLAICLITAIVLSYVSEIFKDYTTSRIFLTIFLIGVPTIWFILFRIEKNKLEKDELDKDKLK